MSINETGRGRERFPALRLVDGGARARAPAPILPIAAPPGFGPCELAADMARLFAMALVAECPIPALSDPHHVVDRGAGPRFSLHDLLCELRSLPWHDSRSAQLTVDLCGPEAGPLRARRAQHWNADGQVTLGTLFRAGLARPVPGGLVSAALSMGPVACAPPGTLSELAARIRATHPAQPFRNMMLDAFGRGVPLDEGLAGPRGRAGGWSASRCMALMAEAEARALRVVSRVLLRTDRPTRPVVTAARMTVILSRDTMVCDAEGAILRAAVEELATFAPGLLDWVTHANRADRGIGRFGQNLFLPLGAAARDPAHPSDVSRHVVIAGAQATLVKALFDTAPRLRVPRAGEAGPDPSLADEVDRLAGNVCLARTLACTHYPAEDHVELRAGEAIAMHLLRDALEVGNRSASVRFRDFDGCDIRIAAHPRSFGRGHAELFVDRQPRPWPQDGESRAAHLTAVV